jgi:hypothetical protein
MIPLDRRTAFAHLSPWLAVALQQRLLTTASPGSLPVPLTALVVSASLFTLSSQIGGSSQGITALTESWLPRLQQGMGGTPSSRAAAWRALSRVGQGQAPAQSQLQVGGGGTGEAVAAGDGVAPGQLSDPSSTSSAAVSTAPLASG